MTDQRTCPVCRGRGTRPRWETTTEPDTAMSVVMGAATGIGYFPMRRTVSKTVQATCARCHGTGKIAG